MSDIVMRINRGSIRLVLAGTVPTSGGGGGTEFPTIQASSVTGTDRLYAKIGANERYETINQITKYNLGNKTWLDSWVDNTPFSGFELSRLFYTTRWSESDAGGYQGAGLSLTETGTAAQALVTNRGMLRSITQASASSAGGLRRSATNSNPMYQRGSAIGENGFLLIDIFIPSGTNWNNTGVGTGTRWISGITSSATSTLAAALGSDNPTNNRLAFMRSHVNGGLTETNWWFSAKDGTTENRLDTGIAFTGNSWYATMIACAPQGGTIYYAIKDLTGGSDSGVLSTSSNLPAADTFLYQYTGFYNIDAVSRVCYAKTFVSYVPNLLRAYL